MQFVLKYIIQKNGKNYLKNNKEKPVKMLSMT